jgi:hypothetical protein
MSTMTRRLSRLLALVAGLTLLATACGPAATPTPIARTPAGATPTAPAPTFTSTVSKPTASPTSQPSTATSTSTFTATPIPATPTLTSTPLPPTLTFTPSPLPPTATFTPTLVPPTPTSTPTPTPPPITDWRGEYYANRTLTPPSLLVRNDRVVDLSLGSGESPAPSVPSENWSARWTRTWNFAEGNYRFRALVDDGARLWVDEMLIIDAWTDGGPREFTANLYLQGEVSIRLEYYNHLGDARARLNWERVTEYPDWKGSYFANRDLSGLPRLQRNEPTLDLDFGTGAPVPYLPADNFSARWTRRLRLDRSGTYRFRLVSDDGARLWINDRLIIDVWHDGPTTNEVFSDLEAGEYGVRVEYYEHLGNALIQVDWSFVAPPATPTFTPTPKPTLTPKPKPTLTPTSTAPKPSLTPTSTPPKPYITPSPTASPPALQPSITLEPPAGPIGEPITVIGQRWLPNVLVSLYLAELDGPLGDLQPVGDGVADAEGRFRTRIVVPQGTGWEDRPGVRVVARSEKTPEVVAIATYMFEAGEVGVSVPFSSIPAEEERLALTEPAFLALTSFDEWDLRFGPEPVPAVPRINWEEEIVIGVFLGFQSPDVDATIASIERRGQEIRVQLESPVPNLAETIREGGRTAQSLVRMARSALPESAQPDLANVDFTFFDGDGRLLAYGSGTSIALEAGEPGARMLEAPQAQGAPPELQAEGAAPEVGAEALPTPGADEGLKVAPAEEAIEPAPQPTQAAAERAGAPRVTLVWLGVGLWILLVAAVGVGAGVLIWRSRRQE